MVKSSRDSDNTGANITCPGHSANTSSSRQDIRRKRRLGVVWTFKTAKLTVSLHLERDRGYAYDGDDENGETQAKLNSGEYVAFNSSVLIELEDGTIIARDCLGGSVYAADDVAAFYTAHRDTDAMNRNCSLMRAERGNVSICHYFPSMVAEACSAARELLPRKRT